MLAGVTVITESITTLIWGGGVGVDDLSIDYENVRMTINIASFTSLFGILSLVH